MNCVLIIFLASLAINSGFSSSALSEISDSPSKKNYNTEELGTCPMNSSISVTLFLNLRDEWLTTFVDGNKLQNFTRSMDHNLEKNVIQCGDLTYISISGFLKDTEPVNSTEATVGDYRNNTDGEANDFLKWINDLTTNAEDNANHTRKALQILEQRMNSFEKTLNNNTETLINFEKTQNNITENLINFEKTLTNIEQILNEMRVISNFTKNLVTEDKEKATSTLITKAKAQITFDSVFKGSQVQLSSDLRTATRMRRTFGYGYAGVVSNSILEDDKVFQIRIDETNENWMNDGIGIGVIQEKQEGVKDAVFIFDDIKGTWSIRSWSGSQSGKSDTWKDGKEITTNGYPLSTKHFPIGTILGVSRRSDGNLHFYLNGVDKGAAFRNVPKDVYAFVDVIAYVNKISIMN